MGKKGIAAFMASPGKLEYREYELPHAEKGGLVVKVTQTNVCGSELHIWKGSMQRTTLGHEFVGVVDDLGEGVTTDCAGRPLSTGDRVTATYFEVCGKCFHCAHGEFERCDNTYRHAWQPPENYPFKGTFATHYQVNPDQYFYKVPENIPDCVAAGVNCAVSQVLYGLDAAGLKMNDTIVIQGAGGLGLYGCAAAKTAGAKVIIVDGVESRLQTAVKFGADYTINMKEFDTVEKRTQRVKELTEGKGADITMEVTGVAAAFAEGLGYTRPCGTYLTMGNVTLGSAVTLDPAALTKSQVRILPVNRYKPWFLDKALQFISATIDRFPYVELMNDDFTFDQIEDALNQSAARQVTRASIKVR